MLLAFGTLLLANVMVRDMVQDPSLGNKRTVPVDVPIAKEACEGLAEEVHHVVPAL